MKKNLLLNILTIILREYIFIFLTATIFLLITFTKSFADENVFTINEVKVEGSIDSNFSRDKYIDKAFLDSFDILMNKILVRRDLEKVSNLEINDIKNLVLKFQILEESYTQSQYKAVIKIFYNDSKVKNFLGNKNISYSEPENITAVFFPILFINGEIKNFSENFFYNNWIDIKIKNELINFILPIEDLEDLSKIIEMKNNIEKLNINSLVNKYDVKNYVFVLMEYQNSKLNTHIKTNFNNNTTRKNLTHKIQNINDELLLTTILKDLKIKVTDLWKEENLINLLMPLSIKLKFQHFNSGELDKLKNIFNKISIIDSYSLEEFNINNSFFKVYYYGNPKKLKTELIKFGYQLKNKQGQWELYK